MMTGRDVGGDVPSEMTAICAKQPAAISIQPSLGSQSAMSHFPGKLTLAYEKCRLSRS